MKISGPTIGTSVSAVHNLPAVAPNTITRPVGTDGSNILHILGFLKQQLTGKRFIKGADVESICYLLAADILHQFLQIKDTSLIATLRQILDIMVIRWRTDV